MAEIFETGRMKFKVVLILAANPKNPMTYHSDDLEHCRILMAIAAGSVIIIEGKLLRSEDNETISEF